MASRLAILTAVAFSLVGCSGAATGSPQLSGPASSPAADGQASLTIYAAASLKAALAKAQESYEAAHPGTTLTISTDSSAALETKIEQGAPADLFLSADTTNAQRLVDKGLASGPVTPFAGNLLTIIVPAANHAAITKPADLAKPGVKVIAAGDSVPITKYATQLVANLAATQGAAFAAGYSANVVSKEDNVAAVVSKIELGEGDAAIVYVTDAKTASAVSTIEVPVSANVPATYGGVVVNGSPNHDAAAAFLARLSGPDGRSVLASFGFLPP